MAADDNEFGGWHGLDCALDVVGDFERGKGGKGKRGRSQDKEKSMQSRVGHVMVVMMNAG